VKAILSSKYFAAFSGITVIMVVPPDFHVHSLCSVAKRIQDSIILLLIIYTSELENLCIFVKGLQNG
jgi:hypothetical protein